MAWIARLLALALAGVLIDAAVASVHGPLFAFATAGIGATLAIVAIAALWSRAAIALAATALIVVGAFAIGSLAGSDAGPALTGLDASDAAAIVFAGAIIAAAAAAFVVGSHPLLRTLVAMAGIYAAGTTIAAIRHGGLAAAFDDAPLAWTRGPYVAAEVLLPLAAVAALIYGLARCAQRQAAHGLAALIFAAALGAAGQLGAAAAGSAGLPTIVAFERLPGAAPLNGRSGSGSDAMPPENGPLFSPAGSADVPAEVGAAAAGVAADAPHALAAIAALGNDLYAGSLGGSAGALRGQSANSVDKALLLRDVIRIRMPAVETAFARCTLGAAGADAAIAQVRSAHRQHPPVAMQAAVAAIDSAADPAVRSTLQRWSQTWKALVEQTQDDARALSTELRLAGLTLPAGRPDADRLRAIAAPHVWLRARLDGVWTDLDPTIEGAVPGKTRCSAEQQSATLPDDLYDVLGVRIAVERYRDGRFERTVVLDRTLRTADLGDRDVSFMFAEPVGADPGSGASSPAAETNATLTLTPLLRVGTEALAGTAFSLPAPAASDNAVSAASSAADRALQAQPADPAPTTVPVAAAPAIAAIWLELSVRGPGGPTTVRSPIFDRIGVAARAAPAPPPALVAPPSGADYRALQTIWNVAVSAGHGMSAGGPAQPPAGNDVPAISATLARAHGAYYALRRSLTDDARGASVDVAADRAGLSLLALTNRGTFIDLASDDALPIGDDAARPIWAAASVLAERHVVNGEALLRRGTVDSSGARDALALFADATASGARAIAVLPATGLPAQFASASADARARMTAHLARGASLLALAPSDKPGSTAPSTYWILDPERGTLRDENTDGRHQATVEEGAVDNEVTIKNISTWRKFTCTIMPVIRAAGFALSVAHNSSPFSLGGARGLGAANAAATQQAVKDAQAGLDQPTCAGA